MNKQKTNIDALSIAFLRGLVIGILLCGFGWGLVGYFILK